MSFTTMPSLGSLLKSYAVPEVGGDTLFANMYLAYETLSDGMKKLIAGLHGIHLSGTRKIANDDSGVVRAEEQKRINPPVAQPVVRVHPETGRKALYIGEKVKRFEGMTEDESKPLIDYLVGHATRAEFLYRHQWRANDIIAWDNRCVMHQALGDFDETQLRHMERTTVLGTPSGYVAAA
jgi:taurine dioxygenase